MVCGNVPDTYNYRVLVALEVLDAVWLYRQLMLMADYSPREDKLRASKLALLIGDCKPIPERA